MTTVIYWRVLVAVALLACGWYIVHVIRDNATLRQQVSDQAASISQLETRATAIEVAQVANNTFATENTTQASRGIARNEAARRSDPNVVAIDKPWPAAMRGRVFDNPDPTSGSTEPARVPAAGRGSRDKVPQP